MAAKKEIKYLRQFFSQSDFYDISHHGSPEWEEFQTIGKEDLKLRNEILERFSAETHFHLKRNGGGYEREYFRGRVFTGFDGRQSYRFWISEEFPKSYGGKQNVHYLTTVTLNKTGEESKLSEPCDLESFLMKNGFSLKLSK